MRTYTYQTSRKACYLGSIIQAITVNVPPVFFIIFQDRYQVSYAQLGSLVLLTFAVQIVVDLILAQTARFFKTRTLLMAAGICSFIGYGLLALSPDLFPDHVFIGLLIAALIYSTGSGLIEVMVSPVIDALPNEDKGSSMAFLHSFYCWGQLGAVLLTTGFLLFLGQENWRWILLFWMIFPALDIYLFARVPLPQMQTGEGAGGIKKLLSMKLFWAAMMIMIAAGASELAMSQWASLFAQKGLGLNKTLGDLAGPGFFALLMGTGRVFYGIKGDRLRMSRALMLSALLCIGGYLLTILSPQPLLSLLGCGLCGLSVSIMWPGTLVIASKAIPAGGTALFALLALGGDVGCSLGPWLTGLVSDALQKTNLAQSFSLSVDQLALRGGLLCAIIFPALLLIFTPILTKKKGRAHES
ncbi:MAG: MFS transporter [Lachnospiraceae bacterium]|jgi:MFS family permease|nr:MFS transporter [Lachnospiraceae bacterium]